MIILSAITTTVTISLITAVLRWASTGVRHSTWVTFSLGLRGSHDINSVILLLQLLLLFLVMVVVVLKVAIVTRMLIAAAIVMVVVIIVIMEVMIMMTVVCPMVLVVFINT